jgi:predicted DNA-binding protein (UPF0251 family)
MPFTVKTRCCEKFKGQALFLPHGANPAQVKTLRLGLDEVEAARICDGEGLPQSAAARRMGISTGTVQRLLYAGRRKMIEAVCCGKALEIYKPVNIIVKRRLTKNG